MTRDRLVLVTRLEQLRVGMIVVDKRCHGCGASFCRAMVIRLRIGSHGPSWEVTPDCRRSPDPKMFMGIHAGTIANGRIFRVVDDLEQHDSDQLWRELNETRRKPEPVR